MKPNPEYTPRRKRNQRSDGLSTRAAVLEVAGQIFAERGFAEATSKEICERAGTNSAAVNYYFGGKENLYEEVLVEAHRQIISMEELDQIVSCEDNPEQKLHAYLKRILQTVAASPELWGVKIYLREIASPSHCIRQAMTSNVLPKRDKIRALVQEITGLPDDSKRLERATAFVLLPCISLIAFPDVLRTQILPDFAAKTDALLEDMLAYALAGLCALRETGDSSRK